MLRIAICEDDPNYEKTLLGFLSDFGKEKNVEFRTSCFPDGLSILQTHEAFDLIFMDIEMPGLDGISAAKKLREGPNSEFILFFITNYGSLAIRGYEADALDFLVKPMNFFDFSLKLERALDRLSSRNDPKILLETQNGSVLRLPLSEIMFFEVQDHTMLIHRRKDILKSRITLKTISSKLKDPRFVRINKCYLINLDYLDRFSGNEAILNGIPLLVSRGAKKDLLNAMALYFG